MSQFSTRAIAGGEGDEGDEGDDGHERTHGIHATFVVIELACQCMCMNEN